MSELTATVVAGMAVGVPDEQDDSDEGLRTGERCSPTVTWCPVAAEPHASGV